MVLIFHTIADLWRVRLDEFDRRMATGSYEGWRLALERRVLIFLLRRHSDADYADEPRQARPLDRASAQRSSRLFISNETRQHIGMPRQLKAIVRDQRPGGIPHGTPSEKEKYDASFKKVYEHRQTPYPLEESEKIPSMEEEASNLFLYMILIVLLMIFWMLILLRS